MDNIDSELLLNYYFKDGYMFFCPDRLVWDQMKKDLDIVDVEEFEEMDVDVDK